MELQDLNSSSTDERIHSLNETGFFLFKQLLSGKLINQLKLHVEYLFAMEGDSAGIENPYTEYGVKRLANLAEKGQIFSEFYAHPIIIQAVASVLGDFNLAMLNARKTLPGYNDRQRQAFHTDTDMNQNHGLPDKDGYFSCTVVLFLTDSTIMNGATRIIPKSHLSASLPHDLLTDTTVE